MRHVTRYILLALGWLSLGLAVVGLALPVLPTAPFVLLAAACFMRSSQRLHDRLVSHPILGAHISDFLEGRGLQPRTKLVALGSLWVSVLASTVLVVPLLIADLLLVAVASAVSVYLLRLPTCPSA